MTNQDIALHRNFLLLHNAPEFEAFRAWLRDQQLEIGRDLIASNDDRQLHLAQGAARWVQQFSKNLQNASGVLEKAAG